MNYIMTIPNKFLYNNLNGLIKIFKEEFYKIADNIILHKLGQ